MALRAVMDLAMGKVPNPMLHGRHAIVEFERAAFCTREPKGHFSAMEESSDSLAAVGCIREH